MADAELPIPGATRVDLQRVALRVRGSPVTVSGWRLELESPRGRGAIVLAEVNGVAHYRGDGVCLGLPQESMGRLFTALRPDEGEKHETLQLG